MRKSAGGKQKPDKRVHTGFRPKAELKRRLDASAVASNCSLSEEIEGRLERSFGLWGQMTLCLGDQWSPVQLHRDELLIGVGDDSPQENAVLKFTENLDAFKEHFGIGGKK